LLGCAEVDKKRLCCKRLARAFLQPRLAVC
jgi:hypothetical protein